MIATGVVDDELRIYIVVRRDVGDVISKPKFGVQCSHATLAVFVACLQTDPVRAWQYFNASQPKIVLQVKDAKALLDLHAKARQAGFFAEPIVDAGRTELAKPTLTSIAIGPVWFKTEGQALLKRIRLYESAETRAIVDAKCEGIAEGIASATKACDLHNGLVGNFPMEAEKRADWMLHQMLNGLTIGDDNRQLVKDYLVQHLCFTAADAERHGREEATHVRRLTASQRASMERATREADAEIAALLRDFDPLVFADYVKNGIWQTISEFFKKPLQYDALIEWLKPMIANDDSRALIMNEEPLYVAADFLGIDRLAPEFRQIEKDYIQWRNERNK